MLAPRNLIKRIALSTAALAAGVMLAASRVPLNLATMLAVLFCILTGFILAKIWEDIQ